MRNKFLKTLSLGICCIMFSVVISIPQNNKIVLTPISTHKIIIIQVIDPPFH